MTPAWPAHPGSHTSLFYEHESFWRRGIDTFLADGARAGATMVMIARRPVFEDAVSFLASSDVDALRVASGRIVFADAEITLVTVMDGDTLRADRLEREVRALLERAARVREDGQVWILGEMVDLMCGAGYHGAALDLERLWNVFTADRPIVSGCAYALDRFSHERHISLLPLICDQHTHVIPEEVLAHPSQARERLASIALLQHRARALGRGRDAESQARVDPARTAVSTVYVIDDDPSVRRSLARLVTSVGLPVRTFDSAEAFLDNANTAEGGCLIVDIQLLGMSGMDLMRRLAAVRRHWPVVAMSGADDASVEQAAFRLGAVVFLRKPFAADMLLEAIARALS